MDDPIFEPWSGPEGESAARSTPPSRWRLPASNPPPKPPRTAKRPTPRPRPSEDLESSAEELESPAEVGDPGDVLHLRLLAGLTRIAKRLASHHHEATVHDESGSHGASVELRVLRHAGPAATGQPVLGSLSFVVPPTEARGVLVRTSIGHASESIGEIEEEESFPRSRLDAPTVDDIALRFVARLLAFDGAALHSVSSSDP